MTSQPLTRAEKVAHIFHRCRDDPALFNDVVLGRKLWSKQIEVCNAVARSPITVVPAGRAVGKSFLLAGLALWWCYTRRNSLVITTGPDHRQVVSVLWGEIRKAIIGSRIPLTYLHLTEGYGSPQRLSKGRGTRWEALGFAASTTEGFSGQHADELLVIVDEASGITEQIWDAIHGLVAKRLVISGNPIKYDCRFRELHDLAVGGSPHITTVPISAMEHPHAGLERSPIGAVDRQFLRQMREIYGEGSPWWGSNICGLFPGQETVKFIPAAWIDACIDPAILDDDTWRDHPPGPACMGVDVGGGVGADRSVIVVRNHRQLLEVFASEWHGVLDEARHRLEPVVIELARRWGVEPGRCIYDRVGIGRSFGSYLENLGYAGAIGYHGAGKGGRDYVNRRTANAYAIRRRLDPQRKGFVPFYCGGIPEWPSLRRELSEVRTPVTEMDEGTYKQRLEDKEEFRARLKRSPDFLDALLMSFTYID